MVAGGERLSSSSSAAISSSVSEVRWLSGASSSSSSSGGGGAVEIDVCDIIGSRCTAAGGDGVALPGRGTWGRVASDGAPPGRGTFGGVRSAGAGPGGRFGIECVDGGGRWIRGVRLVL